MKTLVIGIPSTRRTLGGVTYSSLSDHNPFGYDTIIVDVSPTSNFIGNEDTAVIWDRWRQDLRKWLTTSHRLIIFMRPFQDVRGNSNNYNWLPFDTLSPTNFTAYGRTNFIGDVVATDTYMRQYLQANENTQSVSTIYKNSSYPDHIHVNSKIDNELITSFTWREDSAEVIFIPENDLVHMSPLLNSFASVSNKWKVQEIEQIESTINDLNQQIDALTSTLVESTAQLDILNTEILNLISSDIYLSRAVKAYDSVHGLEDPEPERFYEALESIENAFNSEREMREALDFSNSKIGRLTRRTNEFRHVARDGQTPSPLTNDEISEFTELIEKIIAAYISYLRHKL